MSFPAFSQVKIKEKITIHPGQKSGMISSSLDGFLHDIQFEFKISPADTSFQPRFDEFVAPGDSARVSYYVGDTLKYGYDVRPGQTESVNSYGPSLGTNILDCVGQGVCWIIPYYYLGADHPPNNFPYLLSWKVTIDGIVYEDWEYKVDSLHFDYDEESGYNWFWGMIRAYNFINMRSLYLSLHQEYEPGSDNLIVKGKQYFFDIGGEEITKPVTIAPYYWCPTVDPVDISIVKGSDYVWLVNGTDTTRQFVGLVKHGLPYLQTASDIPDSVDQYCVIRTHARDFVRLDTAWFLPKDTLLVTFEPSRITLGDTAIIHMHRRLNGEVFEEECTESREVGILGDEYYGTLLNENGDTATYFPNVSGQLKFIAAKDMQIVPDTVWIRVGLFPAGSACSVKPTQGNATLMQKQVLAKIEGKEGRKKVFYPFGEYERRKDGIVVVSPGQNGNVARRTTQVMASVRRESKLDNENIFQQPQSAIGGIPLNIILLGQTKYYQAIKDTSNSTKLRIVETGKDTLADCVRCNYTVLSVDPNQKLGIYYEYRDSTGCRLDSNCVIRFIGRYWNRDTTYKVRLMANSVDKSRADTITIKVIRPRMLGKDNSKSIDVFNLPLDIDSLCITLAGKIGIPPQLLKGHIEEESPLMNFGFAPPYRFEPFTTGIAVQKEGVTRKRWENNPFWVTTTSMGTGGSVPTHNNLRFMSYYKEPVKIWKVVEDYSQLTYTSPPKGWTVFAKRLSDGKLDFAKYGYNRIQEKYNSFLNTYSNIANYKTLTSFQRIDSARLAMIQYLKCEYEGGLDSICAQTRIGASYGLTQLLYETALDEGYDSTFSDLPENLNINSIYYPIVEKHYFKKMSAALGSIDKNKTNNWSKCYEDKFKEMIRLWNPYKSGYSSSVFQYMKKYFPIK